MRARMLFAAILMVVSLAPPADAGHRTEPHFRDVYCDRSNIDLGDIGKRRISRDDARNYASTSVGDGYQWGGGCWDADHVDDQPNDPPQRTWTGGEGGDCSGFTFKVWHLRSSASSSGFQYWGILHYVHGPFTADAFRRANGADIEKVSKSAATLMDAFASTSHIGMIWAARATPDGQDMMVEACCERDGTLTRPRAYRSDPSYGGVRRQNWYTPGGPCVGCPIEVY